MLKEFKNFALRGNVIDLAVGVIIGGAFGRIVASLVNDILMPAIGVLLGGINFRELKYIVTPAQGNIAEVAIMYGSFIQSIVDFLIIAFAIFLFVKLLIKMKMKEPPVVPAPPAPSKESQLLEEIRDIMKSQSSS